MTGAARKEHHAYMISPVGRLVAVPMVAGGGTPERQHADLIASGWRWATSAEIAAHRRDPRRPAKVGAA